MPKKRSKFQLKIEELAVRFFIGLIGLLPYKAALDFGKFLGRTVYRLFPRFAKTARRNLEIAYPEMSEAERRKIMRGTFESLGRHLGFISRMRKFELADIHRYVEVVGKKENFDPADASGRGILFITGHFGSWEVFNLLPPAFDHRINILVRRIDNDLVEKYVDSMRTRFGSVTLGKKEAPRQMYKLLERGETLGILADLNAQLHDGVFVDFFNVPASTTASVAKLALKTDAIIIPAFAVWEEEKQKYVVYLEPPLNYEKTGDTNKDILTVTREFTAVIERFVRQYPEQWLWIHKRWNTRPRGEKGLY
jgi:Kdo2-lipid IVA lauroyltransferase/acyltransferase